MTQQPHCPYRGRVHRLRGIPLAFVLPVAIAIITLAVIIFEPQLTGAFNAVGHWFRPGCTTGTSTPGCP
jgi:hypothetical protein